MNYLCNNWQGFMQMCVYLTGRGYNHYCHITYPLKKQSKWTEIDKKLICKYETDKSKFQRTRQKQRGIANFYLLRWQDQVVIFHTEGEVSDALLYDDRFYNVADKELEVKISEDIELRITREKSVTVRLTKESYRGFKALLWDACRSKNRRIILAEFDKLNGLPAWKGIVYQKKMLAVYTVKQAKKYHIAIKRNELRVNTKRKIYKSFS